MFYFFLYLNDSNRLVKLHTLAYATIIKKKYLYFIADFIFRFTEINRKDDNESRNRTTQDNSPSWFECEKPGFYADEHDCRKYYICVRVENKHSKFRRSIYQCDANKVFSDVHMNCTLPQESGRAECGGSVSSEQEDISGTTNLSHTYTQYTNLQACQS